MCASWLFGGAAKPSPPWQEKAKAKYVETYGKIPSEWRLPASTIEKAKAVRDLTGPFLESLLTADEIRITALAAPDIARHIRQRLLTAECVTVAFCKRAAISHQLNNCLHEIFFTKAIERAKQLDSLQTTGHALGPLHGVPVSLKDQFHIPGVETTMGYVGWIGTFEGSKSCGKWKKAESETVAELISLGAVVYCKTSLPQTLTIGETHNNIIGYTMNPVNQKLSCGGSSGGEGSLLALGGSCIGIGTDIGGSVRIPASFCGVYSIKPSASRFSYKDVANVNPGQTIIKSSVGFMSASLSSSRLIMTSLLSTNPWLRDPDVVPIPWRPHLELNSSKLLQTDNTLTLAVMPCDNIVRPHPPIGRAIEIAADAVKRAGHNILPWHPPSHEVGLSIYDSILTSDGNQDIWTQLNLSSEPVVPEVNDALKAGPKQPIALLDLQALALRRTAYRSEYAAYWNSTAAHTPNGRPVDAIIMPVAPHAAVIPGKYFHYGYCDIINLLDCTSISVPLGFADKHIDVPNVDYVPINDTDRRNWEAYEPEVYDGAPIGVQIVGRQLEEERLLSIVEMLFGQS